MRRREDAYGSLLPFSLARAGSGAVRINLKMRVVQIHSKSNTTNLSFSSEGRCGRNTSRQAEPKLAAFFPALAGT